MLNPHHQNININISYNLGGEKQSKPLPQGKKITKNNKPNLNPNPNNCDI